VLLQDVSDDFELAKTSRVQLYIRPLLVYGDVFHAKVGRIVNLLLTPMTLLIHEMYAVERISSGVLSARRFS